MFSLVFFSLFTEKGEFNRKVCIHCNATFHSGVSLSNHLRAYAKRKRTALLEGTSKCHQQDFSENTHIINCWLLDQNQQCPKMSASQLF